MRSFLLKPKSEFLNPIQRYLKFYGNFKYIPSLPDRGEDSGEGAFIFISPHLDLLLSQGEGTFM